MIKIYILSKQIFIIISVVFIASAGLLLYFFFVQGDTDIWASLIAELEDSSSAKEESNQSPEVITEDAVGSKIIVADEVMAPTLDTTGDNIIFYNQTTEAFASRNLQGEDKQTLLIPAAVVTEVTWSPDKKSVVYRDINDEYHHAELAGETETLLGANIDSPAFSSDGQSLWYRYTDPEGKISTISRGTLAQGLADWQNLIGVTASTVLKKVPGVDSIAYHLEPNANRAAMIYRLDPDGNKEMIVNKGRGREVIWSQDGSLMIYAGVNDRGQVKLWLANGDGSDPQKLSEATFIDKVAFSPSGERIYMAVPIIMPPYPEYVNGNFKTEDRLIEINISGGEVRQLDSFNSVTEPIDAGDIFLSKTGNLLYFINRYNNSLYVVAIDS